MHDRELRRDGGRVLDVDGSFAGSHDTHATEAAFLEHRSESPT